MSSPILTYESVYLVPKYSSLKSRTIADTSVLFCGYNFKLPVVPANMQDVIDYNTAKFLSENNYFYIMHRFNGTTRKFIHWANDNKFKLISVSVGTKNYIEELSDAIKYKQSIDFITIDVAHGWHENMKPVISFIKEHFPNTKIIAGNVATANAAKYLADLEVDAIKCGIGGGSICSTKYKTGFHIPTLESIYQIKKELFGIPLIADGGLVHYGDIAKALVFGASMCMSGSWFASCSDSPADTQSTGAKCRKIYRGSTSYAMKNEKNFIEGHTVLLEPGCTYKERLIEIEQALQSSISYAGGKNISCFRDKIIDYIQL